MVLTTKVSCPRNHQTGWNGRGKNVPTGVDRAHPHARSGHCGCRGTSSASCWARRGSFMLTNTTTRATGREGAPFLVFCAFKKKCTQFSGAY